MSSTMRPFLKVAAVGCLGAGVYKTYPGRQTLLRLCAAHLRQMKKENPDKPLVWVDIGGGTGLNIEEMDKYFPIGDFDSVYLIDLCQPYVYFPA
ncbi:hypothetical protein PHLCEN_2v4385 [Hermanssonia centrifuga]|uniref:Uncharacterized protein n=1 Tax=Hermanssonia centrifuga TaxID=98765 RepID=A0A2R6PV92_9APHY|nr:hypothetical protein PHLCEN_2v4385 [Hermanssonia centrifuga]